MNEINSRLSFINSRWSAVFFLVLFAAFYSFNANRALAVAPNPGHTLSQIDGISTWTGNSSISTLGVITAGTWNGTTINDAYISSSTTWNAKQDALGFTPENFADKGIAGGYASLDGSGKIPTSQLPALSISNTSVVADQASMLALTAETGDVAVRTDLNKSFILGGTDPTNLADWQELLTPTDTVLSVNGNTGAVSLTKSDIGLGNVENTALSAWAGSTNLTTLGTITSGTWNGTAIDVLRGGTGLTSLGTANQILGINSGATANEYKTVSGTTNQINIANGAGSITLSTPQNIHTAATPTFSGLTLSGPLGVADGTAAAPSMTFSGATNQGFFRNTAGSFSYSLAGQEIMRFTAFGAGILQFPDRAGVITPTRFTSGAGDILRLKGGDAFGTNQTGGNLELATGAPTGTGVAGKVSVFNSGLTTELLTILNSGFVGINKAVPVQRLDVTGNIQLDTIGNKLLIKEGANASMGVATLVGGTVVVSNTLVTATSRIFLTNNTLGGTAGFLRISARTAGTSFTILSSSGTDTSAIAWHIIEPAP